MQSGQSAALARPGLPEAPEARARLVPLAPPAARAAPLPATRSAMRRLRIPCGAHPTFKIGAARITSQKTKNQKLAEICASMNDELLQSYGKFVELMRNQNLTESFNRVARQSQRVITTLEPSDATYFIDLMGRLDAEMTKMIAERIAKIHAKTGQEVESEVPRTEIGFKHGTVEKG